MRLEIGAFHVKDIKFGDRTGYDKGILTVNKEELLKVVREDEHITAADQPSQGSGPLEPRGCPVRFNPLLSLAAWDSEPSCL